MKLIVHECNPSVYQKIRVLKNLFLVAIRPHLYIHSSPVGTIKVQLQDESGRVISESNSSSIASLKTGGFAHGYFKFDITSPLVADRQYRVAIVCGGGYSFAEGAYVGACKDWDSPKTVADYSPSAGFDAPLDIELWFRSEA